MCKALCLSGSLAHVPTVKTALLCTAEMEEQPYALVRLLQGLDARHTHSQIHPRERHEAQGECGQK